MFFALFSVLRAIAEWQPGEATKYGMSHAMVASAQNAKILGVTIADKFLTAGTPLHVRIVILLTVIVSMITTYLTVRQSMKRGMMPAATPDNPMGQSQKYMAYIMPFFALSGLYWPFGLVLYWVTTNLWTVGQGLITRRLVARTPAPGPERRSSRTPPKDDGSSGNGASPEAPGPKPAPSASQRPRQVRRKKKRTSRR
jgi:YidC/Oxa1 family membrane protein insertase